MRAGQLGDTVFATSIIEPLRQRFGPQLSLDLVLKRGLGRLFSHDERIGRTFELAHRNLPIPLNLDKLRVVTHSRRRPYDLAINLETGSLLDDLVRAVRSDEKVGSPYGTTADDRQGEHAVTHLHRFFRSFLAEGNVALATPSLCGAPWEEVSARHSLPRDYIVLNPTNSHFGKRDHRTYRAWPLEHWRQLIRSLVADRSERVVIVGGKGEREYFRHLGPLPAAVLSLAGQTRLDELVTVLSRAKAVVTTDTGPAHLAAAVNAPVVAIFGPSDDRKTGPYATPDNAVHILNARLDCSPCSLTPRIKECPWNRCMHEVTPQQVLDKLAEVLGQYRA